MPAEVLPKKVLSRRTIPNVLPSQEPYFDLLYYVYVLYYYLINFIKIRWLKGWQEDYG